MNSGLVDSRVQTLISPTVNQDSDPDRLLHSEPRALHTSTSTWPYHVVAEGQIQDSSLLIHEPGRVEKIFGDAQVHHAVVVGGKGQRRRGKGRGPAVGQPEKLPLGVEAAE